MAADIRHFSFTKQGGLGSQTILVPGMTLVPKLLIVMTTVQTALGPDDKSRIMFGVTNGVTQVCNTIHHPDNEAATTSSQAQRLTSLVFIVSATSGGTPTVQVEGQITGFVAGGFVINWITNDGNATIFSAAVAAGAGVSVDFTGTLIDMAVNGTKVVTTGWQPDCFLMVGNTEGGTYNLGAPFGSIRGFGFSDGASVNVGGWTLGRGTGGASDTDRGQHTDRCATVRVANLTGGADLSSIQISAISSTGYTIKRVFTATSNPTQYIVALKGVSFAMGSFTIPTAPGTHVINHAMGVQPLMMILEGHGTTLTTTTGLGMSVGMWDRQSGAYGGHWIGGNDATSPSVYARDTYQDAAIRHRTPAAVGSASAVLFEATVTAYDDSNLTLTFPTVSGSALPLIYLLLGDADADESGFPSDGSITTPVTWAEYWNG